VSSLRKYLIAGLLVWLPLAATVVVIRLLINLLDKTILFIPPEWRPETVLGFSIPGFGVIVGIFILLVTGMLAANLLGRRLVAIWESILGRIPLVRTIYTSVKQVLETLFTTNSNSFRKVVLVEYPRKGIWTLAFQTGESGAEIRQKLEADVLSIFVPTTPNPTSGFFLMVPRQDIIVLDMSVDDGLKMIISAGVVIPKEQKEALVRQHARAS